MPCYTIPISEIKQRQDRNTLIYLKHVMLRILVFGLSIAIALSIHVPLKVFFVGPIPDSGQIFWAPENGHFDEQKSIKDLSFRSTHQEFHLPMHVLLRARSWRWDPCNCDGEFNLIGARIGFGPFSQRISSSFILSGVISDVTITDNSGVLQLRIPSSPSPDPYIILDNPLWGDVYGYLLVLLLALGVIVLLHSLRVSIRLGRSVASHPRVRLIHHFFDRPEFCMVCRHKIYPYAISGLMFVSATTFAYRLYVSVDGYLYLSSAQSIVDSTFLANYHAVREPLYPIFLSIFLWFGLPTISYAIASALLLGTVIIGAASKLALRQRDALKVAFAVAATPTVLGYAGVILQQHLIMVLLVWLVGVALGESNEPQVERVASRNLRVALGAGLCALVSLVLLPVAAVATFLATHSDTRSPQKWWRKWQKSLAVQVVVASPTVVWSLIKASAFGLGDAVDGRGFRVWIWQYSGDGRSVGVFRNTAGFLGIMSDLPDGIYRENIVYGLGRQVTDCAIFDPFVPSIVEYALDGLSISCAQQLVVSRLSRLSVLSGHFTTLALCASIVVALVLATHLVRLPNHSSQIHVRYLLLVVAFSVPYVVFGPGISRYSVPMYAPALLYLAQVWRSSQSRSDGLQSEVEPVSHPENIGRLI